MKLVLNGPMSAHDRIQQVRFTGQRRNVKAALLAVLVVELSLAVNPDDTLQTSPVSGRVKILEVIRVANGPSLSFFKASVSLFDGLGGFNRDAPTWLSQGIIEQTSHLSIKLPLVL